MRQKQDPRLRRLTLERLEPRLTLSGVTAWMPPHGLSLDHATHAQQSGGDRQGEGEGEGEGDGASSTPVHFFYGAAYPSSNPNSTQLVTVDAASGEVTWIGQPMSNPGRIHGMVLTTGGEFYGINNDPNNNGFYAIDRATGQPTLVGPSGYWLAAGLAYDRVSDTIYGVGKSTASSSVQQLLIFDRTSGAATPVGPGVSGLVATSGLAWDATHNRVIAFDNDDDQFVGFDAAGNATTLFTKFQMPTSTWGLACHDGYVTVPLRDANPETRLTHFDPATGEQLATAIRLDEPLIIGALDFGMLPGFATGGENAPGYVAIAYSPWAPHQYAYQLVTILASNGHVNWRGDAFSAPAQLDGLVLTKDFKLYAIDGSAGDFYSVNWFTGQATRVGPTGYDLAYGLAYDAATDTIYGLGKLSPSDTVNRLLVFNRSTGAATAVGPGTAGLTGTSGITWDPVGHRLVVFDHADFEFWSFDTAGNATRLSDAQQRLGAWGMAHDGQHVVLPVRWNYDRYLTYYRADSGQSAGLAIRFSEPMAFESLEYVDDAVPQVAITGVADGDALPLSVLFDAYDGDSDAEVSLFYDDDNQGCDGHLITAGLSESDGSGSFAWDFRGVSDGEYFLYARIDDGVNLPQFSYAVTPVTIRSPSIQGRVFLDRNGNGTWDAVEQAQAGVPVYWDQDGDGAHRAGEPMAYTLTDDPSTDIDETGQYSLVGLAPGTHTVRLVVSGRFVQAYPAGNAGQNVPVVDTNPVQGIDFGIHSALQNAQNMLDVNADNHVTPIDALLVINWLNLHSADSWPERAPPYRDVNGDLMISPLDALLIVNQLTRLHAEGEGEADDAPVVTGSAADVWPSFDNGNLPWSAGACTCDHLWHDRAPETAPDLVADWAVEEDLVEAFMSDRLAQPGLIGPANVFRRNRVVWYASSYYRW